MNRPIALNVVCCDPVATSPDTCDRPAGVSAPNTIGMPPVVLKKLVNALATFCWLTLRPPPKFGRRRRKVQRQIEIGILGVVAQRRMEVRRQVGVDDRTEGAADGRRSRSGWCIALRHSCRSQTSR